MDESQALQALNAILSRPEFKPSAVSLWDVFWSAVWEQVREFLAWLLSPMQDMLAGRISWLQLGAASLAVVVLIAACWFAARVVAFSVVRDRPSARANASIQRERSDHLWTEAQDLATRGQLAEAVRSLYLSGLYALAEHDVLHVEEALTNREHALRLARARPEAGESLTAIVERYEPLRYGARAVTREAFDELGRLVQRLRLEPR